MTQRVSTAVRRQPRRSFLLLAGLAAAALASLLLVQSEGQATSGGSAYDVPGVVDTNPNPRVVQTTITSNETSEDLGPVTATNAQTYNGSIPGPTFHLEVGDHVIVRYVNNLEHASGIHWHGIELPNGVDGTPFTQNMVDPGENFLYKFTVTRPGIFWYHPHHHSSTNQVFKGLYGMIIVEDPNENQLQSSGIIPPDSRTFPVVLSDTTVCKNVGSNDAHTYDDNDDASVGTTQPWAGGAANTLPHQAPPTPSNLCQGPAVNNGGNNNPYPIDENGDLTSNYSAGEIPAIQTKLHAGRTNEGQTVLTNGVNVGARGPTSNTCCGPDADGYAGAGHGTPASGAQLLNVRPGQGIRLQLLNASAVRYMRLHLARPDGSQVPLRRIGGEGGLLNNAVTEGGVVGGFDTEYTAGEILLPPGTRADVVAAIPAAPTTGTYTLWTRDFNRTGLGFSNIATVPVMHLNLSGSAVAPAYTIPNGTPLRAGTGDPVEALGVATGNLLTPTGGFVPPKQGSANQNIQLTQAGNEAGVDNVFGTHDVAGDYKDAAHLNSTRYAQQGDILQLQTTNTTSAHHPFHEHGFSIQPLGYDMPPLGNFPAAQDYVWPYPEFRDNVDIPNGGRLIFRMRLDPRPMPDGRTPGGALGRWVFHCHIFFHATDGMLSELVITNSSGNERPNINPSNYLLRVPRGRQAAVTGTFGDLENNPVSLSSSVGNIANTGGGTFRWRLRKPRGADKIVYLTATDSNGLKGQIPVHLNKWPELTRFRVQGGRIKFKLSEAARVKFVVRGGGTKRFTRRFRRPGRKSVKVPRGFSGGVVIARATDFTGLKSRKYRARF